METFPPILIDIILKRWETLLTLVMIVTTPTDLNDFKMIGECMKCMFLPSDDYFLTLDDDKGSQRCSLWTEHKRQKAVYLFRFVRMESMMSENNDTFHVIYPHPPCALDPRETPGRQSRQDGPYYWWTIGSWKNAARSKEVKLPGSHFWFYLISTQHFEILFSIQLNSWAQWEVVTQTVSRAMQVSWKILII